MKYFILVLALGCFATAVQAQTWLSGQVKNQAGEPVAFASVFLKDIYDGTATDENGRFSFSSTAEGPAMLVVRSINYLTLEEYVELEGDSLSMEIQIQKAGKSLAQVVITAGAFEASDEKKGTILKPLDIVTNAGASGDVYGALQTLPGVAPAGNETGIFVRGGDAYESQTFIDGTLVKRPFFGDVPNVPSRGRFDPFLFKGTLFTTGAYSAEYGQALSSVLLLDTQDMPERAATGVGLTMAGLSVNHTHIWDKNTAINVATGYNNLAPLFGLVTQNVDWDTPPRGYGGGLNFRRKTKNGIFKSYLNYQSGEIAIRFPDLDQAGEMNGLNNQNRNLYWNNSFRGIVGGKWSMLAALSFSRDYENVEFDSDVFGSTEYLGQAKLRLSRDVGSSLYLKIGAELRWSDERHRFNEFEQLVNDWFTAIFSEGEWRIGSKLAFRLGLRGEFSSFLDRQNLAPRSSLAFRTGAESQVSLAYGQFYQNPQTDYLRQNNELGFERSSHYILNYQWMTDDYSFRAELYAKEYRDLVREGILDNGGFGHARGIDLFWRDRKTINKLDYWLTYSYIDAERLYQDFPEVATPDFVTDHTMNLIANYRILSSRVQLGMAYTYATGRRYFNPNSEVFLADKTIDYHNVNLNISYLTSIFRQFSVLFLSLRNPPNVRQVFGYRYSTDGSIRTPILPAANRSFFLGLFISFQ